MKLPPIPKRIHGAGGAIKVVLTAKHPMVGEDKCWGTWDESKRKIKICTKAPLEWQWKTLFHELAHAVLSDSGIQNLLENDSQETICDAFATARFAEMTKK